MVLIFSYIEKIKQVCTWQNWMILLMQIYLLQHFELILLWRRFVVLKTQVCLLVVPWLLMLSTLLTTTTTLILNLAWFRLRLMWSFLNVAVESVDTRILNNTGKENVCMYNKSSQHVRCGDCRNVYISLCIYIIYTYKSNLGLSYE